MKYCRPLALLSIALLLTACGGSAFTPPEMLPPLASGQVIHTAWRVDLVTLHGDQTRGHAPWLRDEQLYFADPRGHVYAYAADTGRRVWETDTDSELTLALGGNTAILAVGTRRGEVIALDVRDGAIKWRTSVSSEVLGIARSNDNDSLLIRTGDEKIHALNPSTGARLWLAERTAPLLTLRGVGLPALAGDRVIAGFANGKLAAFKRQDGTILWEITVATPQGRSELEQLVDIDTTPLIRGDTLYSVAYQGRLVAVGLQNGRLLWSKEFSAYHSLAADNERLFLVDAAGLLWAIDPQTGSALWKQDLLAGRLPTPPLVHGDYIIVGDGSGQLHWFNRQDGTPVARYTVDANQAIHAAPLSDAKRIYAISAAGGLEALH